jgi:hypothetical protein
MTRRRKDRVNRCHKEVYHKLSTSHETIIITWNSASEELEQSKEKAWPEQAGSYAAA